MDTTERLSTRQAAELLGITEQGVKQHVYRGNLAAARVPAQNGGIRLRFDPAEVLALRERLTRPTESREDRNRRCREYMRRMRAARRAEAA